MTRRGLASTDSSSQQMHPPLVSICVPLYNPGAYIEPTIMSVVNQTYPHWELILVDDCSTDGSDTTVERLLASIGDSRIKYYVNPTRLGMVGNWNRAVELATGEFIKLSGQDDLLRPDCIAAQAAILQQHSGVTVVTCARQVISPRGRPVLVRSALPREGIHDGRQTIRRCLRAGTNIIGEPVAVLFRASTLGTKNLFEPSIIYCTDLDLWLRLLGHGDLYFVAAPKSSYRIHAGAATRRLESQVVEDFFRLIRRMEERGYFKLHPMRRLWLRLKVRILTFSRKVIYTALERF